jgi:phosphatidylglycerol:prolipoprotein diacylglycerol transferase
LPWGVSFPTGSIPYLQYGQAHLHPSQLYSSLYGLSLFLLLHFLLKRRAFVGQIVAILFMCEAVFRFLIEYVRFYESAMIIQFGDSSITYNQLIAVGLFVVGLGVYFWQKKRQAVAA